MTKKYEKTINFAYESVTEDLKQAIKEQNARYSTELVSSVGFGNIATFIFKALDHNQRGELMSCATGNTLITGEVTQKRLFYLLKRIICEVA